jgi:hypothetical protein
MQTTYLQSMIATNAASINVRQAILTEHLEDAAYFNSKGETAFAIDSYKIAKHQRAKLAKLVGMQRALRTELLAAFRLARIDRKIAKLEKVGFVYNKPELTSVEIEHALDKLIEAFVPKKPDSRGDTFGL